MRTSRALHIATVAVFLLHLVTAELITCTHHDTPICMLANGIRLSCSERAVATTAPSKASTLFNARYEPSTRQYVISHRAVVPHNEIPAVSKTVRFEQMVGGLASSCVFAEIQQYPRLNRDPFGGGLCCGPCPPRVPFNDLFEDPV
eukprot:TRINITY_DN4558_c0_g1_i1.p1 TRINITY_DN4558_c0_g1~~TRINITY_DN4558_c0_g1_i1.p1  ORF type:complete len:146 (+),score=6.25 TRINITY_DN4558_c0_g1_i1:213-650(+)